MSTTPKPSEQLRRIFAHLNTTAASIDTLPLLREINRDLEALFKLRFGAEAGPDGPWAPNAPRTIKRKGHGIRLHETGALEQSLARRNYHTIVEWRRGNGRSYLRRGTRRPWAALNNYGGRRIPSRRFMGLTPAEVKGVAAKVRVFYIKQLKARLGARS